MSDLTFDFVSLLTFSGKPYFPFLKTEKARNLKGEISTNASLIVLLPPNSWLFYRLTSIPPESH